MNKFRIVQQLPDQLPESPSNPDSESGIVGSRNRSNLRVRLDKDRERFLKAIGNHNQQNVSPTVLDSLGEESDAEVSPQPTKAKKLRQNRVKTGKMPVVVSSGEDSEPVLPRLAQRSAQKQQDGPRTPRSSMRQSSPSANRDVEVISGGPSGAAPIRSLRKQYVTTPTRSSKRVGVMEQQRYGSSDKSLKPSRQSRQKLHAESDDSADSLMNELKNSARKSRAKPQKIKITSDEEVLSEDAVRGSTYRRKLFRRIRSPSAEEPGASEPGSDGETNQNTPWTETAARTRPKRPDKKKTAREKQLERLRQRRSGRGVASLSDDDLEIGSPEEHPHADANEVSDANEDSQVAQTHQETSQDLDDYEEDFIVEDDDTIGAPVGLDNIPIEFTRHAHKKPFEHFKDVVEWMIHNKLNPAFARNDPVYIIAVQKMDDEAQAFAGSKFMSAAWKAEFLKALKKYPELKSIAIPKSLDQKCEACGRSGHPAKHQLIFSGKPYHRKSLESVSSDEQSDDDSEQPPETVNKTVFLLGSKCNANAVTAHALQHWRHALNEFVLDKLDTEGHTSSRKIIERADWSVKKRETYANGIMTRMVADNSMRGLYKEFKQNLAAARDAKNEVSRYGR
ncbi:MAG: hypothetical protein Q9202_005211 [Teloschistes flavicans]